MNSATLVAGVDTRRLQRLSEHLQRQYLEPGRIPGYQLLVARRGQVLLRESSGLMDVARARPMQDDALFRIYSMTKPITTVALMMLYEEGRFLLNDPVQRFIPRWKDQRVWISGAGADMQTRPPRQPMTMRHLLNHSSGLTYGAALLPAGAKVDPVDQVYRDLQLNTRSGTRWRSSSTSWPRCRCATTPARPGPIRWPPMSAVIWSS
jgi:CubicO group peptidase (beta-lactamase class C family)